MVDRYSGWVSLLDCTLMKFNLNRKLSTVDDDDDQLLFWYDICYIEDHDLIVLSSWTEKRICAMRSSNGQIVWDKSKQVVNGEEWKPHGLVFVHNPGLLLAGDRWEKRIMILSPNTGDILQIISLEEGKGWINNLHVMNDTLIVHQNGKLSQYSVRLFYTIFHISINMIII